MYQKSVKWVILAALCCLALFSTVHAQQDDVAGASDYAGFQRFPGSDITDYRTEDGALYNLALGRMQRVDGRVLPSQSERLVGQLTRITYQIPSGYTAEEAYRFLREQLLAGGRAPLFECQGRGCGSSNFWANDKFGNRVLYGPETNQFYLASTFRSDRGGQVINGYAALYAITRANRRVYVHLDFLTLPEGDGSETAMTPEATLLRLTQEGSVVVRNLSFDGDDRLLDDSGIELVVQTLRRDSLLQVHVVGHLQGDDDLDTLLARSAARAEALQEALVAAGIDPSRLGAHGVGPLAPFCRPGPCEDRVELVLR